MQAEIEQAYNMAKSIMRKLELANKKYTEALERKGEAEISHESVVAFVTRELDNGAVSKAALPGMVKGDPRVLESKAELIRATVNVKHQLSLVSFLEKSHDLEKKRMSAEIEEGKRFNYNQ